MFLFFFTYTTISDHHSPRSAAKLAYEDVQDVIDGKILGGVPVIPEHDASAIEHDIKILDGLTKQMRARRFLDGALASDDHKLSFKLDDSGMPVDCWPCDRVDAQQLVEEVIVLFNSGMCRLILCSVYDLDQHFGCQAYRGKFTRTSPSSSSRHPYRTQTGMTSLYIFALY
jgi:exoribonuclease II